jgi:hypothetical protein
MKLFSIHDKFEKYFDKRYKVDTNSLPVSSLTTWELAKEQAKKIKLNPGWSVYFVREEGYVDHVAIAINQEAGLLNLAEAVLLHAAPSPIGIGVGPLTDHLGDKSGLRVATALEYIEDYPKNFYKKIFVGHPPNVLSELIHKAGEIAETIAKSGLIDGKPVVYSFSNIPIVKKYFVSFFDTTKQKPRIERIKKLKKTVAPFYCGQLVADIWKRAGITDLPQMKFLTVNAVTSFTLFDWAKKGQSILDGLSWD